MFTQFNVLTSSDSQNKNSEVKSVDSKLMDISCPTCSCRNLNEKQFCEQSDINTKEAEQECLKCSKHNVELQFQSKLQQQEDVYNIQRPFACQLCSSTFDRASQLEYHHRNIHLKEKSQICQFCGKGFFRKADLNTHLNIHLGTNFCICEICGRKFNHISNLIRHSRMHTGTKPYPCLFCGKRFTQISSLVRHKNIHIRDRQYSYSNKHKRKLRDCISKDNKMVSKRQHYCQTCGESFRFIFLLREHQKSHTQNTEPISSVKSYDKNLGNNKSFEQEKHKGKYADFKGNENKSCEKMYIISTRNDTGESELVQSIIYVYPEQVQEESLHTSNSSVKKLLPEYHSKSHDNIIITDMEASENIDFNVSETLNSYNCGHKEVLNNEGVTFNEHNNIRKKNNVVGMQKENKNNFHFLLHGNKLDTTVKEGSFSTKMSKHFTSSEGCISKDLNKEYSCERKPDMFFGFDGNELYVGSFEPKSKTKDVRDILPQDKQVENRDNTLLSPAEPILCPIQAETGEQFYELIMNISQEKMPDNYKKSNTDAKVVTLPNENNKHTDRIEYNLDNLMSVEHDLNCALYDLSDERKRLSTLSQENEQLFYTCLKSRDHLVDIPDKDIQNMPNLSLTQLGHDSEMDFENYVEKGFNVFGKATYEHNTEQFLEFIETTEGSKKIISNSAYKQSLHSPENGNEHIFYLLEDSQNVEELTNECSNNRSDATSTKINLVISNTDNIKLYSNEKGDTMTDERIYEEITNINSENIDSKCSDDNAVNNLHTMKKLKEASKKFECDVCKKFFSTAYSYKQHLGTHFTDQQKFHCKLCKLSFAWKSTLNKHIANNHRTDGPQIYVCEICPKVYRTLSQVNEHVKRDHLKQRNHICPFCGKSFFKKFDLKTHSRTHTDERPYICRSCGKTFHHKSHIIRHERIHSGERPYSCDICHKSFTQPSSLKAHKQKHQQAKIDIMDCQFDEDDPLVLARL